MLGGGPTTARATAAVLDVAGTVRLVMLNAALVVTLLPVGDPVRRIAAVLVLLAVASFLPLAVSAVLIARRRRRETSTSP